MFLYVKQSTTYCPIYINLTFNLSFKNEAAWGCRRMSTHPSAPCSNELFDPVLLDQPLLESTFVTILPIPTGRATEVIVWLFLVRSMISTPSPGGVNDGDDEDHNILTSEDRMALAVKSVQANAKYATLRQKTSQVYRLVRSRLQTRLKGIKNRHEAHCTWTAALPWWRRNTCGMDSWSG